MIMIIAEPNELAAETQRPVQSSSHAPQSQSRSCHSNDDHDEHDDRTRRRFVPTISGRAAARELILQLWSCTARAREHVSGTEGRLYTGQSNTVLVPLYKYVAKVQHILGNPRASNSYKDF
ncbi:unnamed protein product [Trichogramma brassicae]|uniref:Uncharacterized protein n=1 Tax=Trichogramma brassicae TaxID=86971 RepID=A0A6H5HX49_9HYME|nr:unnamed protein product [Trichogramma brassicae]